jgi:hypothetical protein
VHHDEGERALTEVEEGLGFETVLPSPSVLEVCEELPHSIVSAVDTGAHGRIRGVVLDLRVAERDERLYVARVERAA